MADAAMNAREKAGSGGRLTRRWWLKACATLGALSTLAHRFALLRFPSAAMLKDSGQQPKTKMPTRTHIVVIGAGAFGGWTALYLLRRGARVTLIDSWGPGNSRASSGGETRVIRGTYGPSQPYTKMAARALELWDENQKRWHQQLLFRIGVLWMAEAGTDQFERASLPVLKEAGIPYEELSNSEMQKRWPQINMEGVLWGVYEPQSGFLTARVACQAVLEGFLAEGGEFRQTA